MGRIKYAISFKPIKDTLNYEVRITNPVAIVEFNSIAANKNLQVVAVINKWVPCPGEMIDSITYGIWTSRYSVKSEYATASHYEHGVATAWAKEHIA